MDPGLRAAQACHVAQAFVADHPDVAPHVRGATLVLLEVPSLDALKVLHGRALGSGYSCSAFHEPDLGDELTAIALGPDARRIVSSLPLAYKGG